MQSKAFIEQLRKTKNMKKEWQSWVDSRISEYQDLVRTLSSERQEQRKFDTEVDANIFEEAYVIKRQRSLESVRSFYRFLENFLQSTLKTRQLVDDVMNGRPNLNRLERDMVAYSIPSVLIDYMRGIDYEDEDMHRLSVANLLRAWKMSLTLISRFLADLEKSGGIKKLTNMTDAVTASSSSCEQYHESQKGLLADIGQDIRDLNQSIAGFTMEVERLSNIYSERATHASTNISATPSRTRKEYGLVPPTPQVTAGTHTEKEMIEFYMSQDQKSYLCTEPSQPSANSLVDATHHPGAQKNEPLSFLPHDAESASRRQLDFNQMHSWALSSSVDGFEMSPPRNFTIYRDAGNLVLNSNSKPSSNHNSVQSSISSVGTTETRKSFDGAPKTAQRSHSPKIGTTSKQFGTTFGRDTMPIKTIDGKGRVSPGYRANVLSSLEGNVAAQQRPATRQTFTRSSSTLNVKRDDIRLDDYDDASLVNLSLFSRQSHHREPS